MGVFFGIVLTLCVTFAMDFALGQAPTFDTPCPEDLTLTPASGQTSITVVFPPPTGNPDSTGEPAMVSCDHEPAGHTFPLGVTLVTCNATDGANSSLVTACSFQVKFGHGLNCTRGALNCLCAYDDKNSCACEQGFTGVMCTVEDGTGCTDANTPTAYCGDSCVGPGSACGCETGWKGPACDGVDDGSTCNWPGSPEHCADCLGASDGPPCTCEVGWHGLSCEIDYVPPKFITCQDNITETTANSSSLVITWEDPIATDNSVISPTVSCYPSSGSSFHIGRTQVTCSVFDGFNNVSDCVFIVTVQDVESPRVTCPVSTNQNVDPGMPDATVVWSPPPSAIDAVEGVLKVTCYNEDDQVVETGDKFQPGMTNVTCLASDSSGNENSCEFVITVTDNEGPVVTCPAGRSQNVEPGMADATVDWFPLPSAQDAVDGVVIDVTCVNEAGRKVESGNRFHVGDSVITCSAFDSSGNEGDCSFVITVIDNEAPIMTCSKDLEAATLPGMTYAAIDWSPVPSSIDAVDGGMNVTCRDDRGNVVESGDNFPVGVTTVTCTAYDNSGNKGSCSFSTNVTDVESPNVTCPVSTNQNVDPGMPDATVVWSPPPSAIDAVEGVLKVTCYNEDDQVVETGDKFQPGMTHVTCLASDSSGNENSCEFVITVTDNEGPVVTCPAGRSQNVEPGMADATVDWSPLPSAQDAVDGVVIDVACVNEAGRKVESGNRFHVGDSVITCSAFDSSGNEGDCSFVITVIDNEAPIMTCSKDLEAETLPGMTYAAIDWSPVPSSIDAVDGGLNVTCRDDRGNVVESGDNFPVGVTTVTCTAYDNGGNEGRCSFSTNVTDVESPNVTCPVSTNQNVDPGMPDATVVWSPPPSAVDAVEGVLKVTCYNEDDQVVETGDKFQPGMTHVTCLASDSSGNENSCEFVITVTDNEGPVVTCPAGRSQNVESGMADAAVDWSPLPSAQDAVDGVVIDVTCVNEAGRKVESGNRFPVGDSVITCSAFDSSGNEGDCSFVITVIDNEAPIMTCSKDLEAAALPGMTYVAIDWSPVPSSIDAVDGRLDVTCRNDTGNIVESGDNFPVGVTTVTCTANDNGGNEGRCSFSTNVTGCSAIFLCQNGGKFSYMSCSCECPPPYAGNNCTDCQPCQNGGSYQNAVTCGCDCPNLYTGLLCSVCQSGDVCLNGGDLDEDTCSCECADGWTGKVCSESTSCVPNDEYPDPPDGVVIEKRISIEIAVISPVLENKTCDTNVNKNSDVCLHLIAEFRQAAEMEYSFLSGFVRVEINQNDIKPGSVIVPHEVIYNYGKMAPSTKGLSAIGIYEQTTWKAVQTGWLGSLKIPTECINCSAPTDKTYMCNTEKPKCPKGLDMVEMQNSQGTWCYYVCQSRCKASSEYCGDGTCYQEPDSDDILCSCPQSAETLYLGSHCQIRVELIWLYVGCGVGGVTMLLLLIILVVCLIQRGEEVNKYKLMNGGDEKEKGSVSSDGVRGELYMVDGDIFPSRPMNESWSSPDTTHLYPYSYIYGKRGGYANIAKTEIFWSDSEVEVEAKETTTTNNDQTSTGIERVHGDPPKKQRNWYFWGNLADPIKGETKLIRMVSGTDE